MIIIIIIINLFSLISKRIFFCNINQLVLLHIDIKIIAFNFHIIDI